MIEVSHSFPDIFTINGLDANEIIKYGRRAVGDNLRHHRRQEIKCGKTWRRDKNNNIIIR